MKRATSITFCCACGLMASPALADIYGFTRFTTNSSTALSQLALEVTSAPGGRVNFKFTNNVGLASSVTGVYFDDDAAVLAGIKSLTQSAGVDFSTGGSPPDLPSGTNIGFSSRFRATANPPPSSNGINTASEYLTIRFDLMPGKVFGDVLSALDAETLRVGLHVQTLPDGESDSYITGDPPMVPSPRAASLALLGLTVLIARRPNLREAQQ